MKITTLLLEIKFPKVYRYRQAQNSLIYLNDVLSGKHGKLEPWERKEFELVRNENKRIVFDYNKK